MLLRLDWLLVEHQFGQQSRLLQCFSPFEFSLQALAVLGLFPGVKLELPLLRLNCAGSGSGILQNPLKDLELVTITEQFLQAWSCVSAAMV